MIIKLIIFIFISFCYSKVDSIEKLIFNLQKDFSTKELHNFQNSYLSCVFDKCLSKNNKYNIDLEFDKNKRLKAVKLIFFESKDFINIEKKWLKDDKLLIDKKLKYLHDRKINTKRIRLFLNKKSNNRSKYTASILLNEKEFILAFYSISEGDDLLNYLESYRFPGWYKSLLMNLKKVLFLKN